MRHVFISPHLDDVVLSCADFIIDLKEEKGKILVITVFTDFGLPSSSLRQKLWLERYCYSDFDHFSHQRKNEDIKAMNALGIPYIHLNFVEATFRTKEQYFCLGETLSFFIPSLKFLYPSKRKVMSGRIVDEDKKNERKIFKKIATLISKKDVLYFPLGIGNHVDHKIIHNISLRLSNKRFYWLDYPYALEKKNLDQVKKLEKYFKLKYLPKIHHQKNKVICLYQSQLNILFKEKIIPDYQEKIFEKRSKTKKI